jgi:hypothetical protein
MLEPLPRWATGCTYPLLPLPHRPSPKSHGSASHNAPFNDFRTAGCFRGCSHSIIFRPPSLLATQVVPTVKHRFRCPRQPWRLHLSRTCVVTFACIRYANRPNRAIDGKRLSLSRFAALPAAPGHTPLTPSLSSQGGRGSMAVNPLNLAPMHCLLKSLLLC